VRFLDFVLVGLPAFAGGTLLSASLMRALRQRSFSGFSVAYRNWHARILDWLQQMNILRFPGACLVDTPRPWIFGESLFLLAALASCTSGVGTATSLLAIFPAAALGAAAAILSLRAEGKRQLLSVQRDLPTACFLLSLLLESGMGPPAALQEVVPALPDGALARELADLVRARSLGIPRRESLERCRRRVPSEEYHLFLNHLQQGERLGIGLSRSFRELSSNLLEAQAHRAETVAQEAAVKMLVPLILFIFPAVFLIILSPVLLNLRKIFGG